jgi:hypothetical protein
VTISSCAGRHRTVGRRRRNTTIQRGGRRVQAGPPRFQLLAFSVFRCLSSVIRRAAPRRLSIAPASAAARSIGGLLRRLRTVAVHQSRNNGKQTTENGKRQSLKTDKRAVRRSRLQQRPVQHDQRDQEIDAQPRHVHERCHEWRRRRRRIESKASKDERQHRAGQRTERHDAHQG